MKVEIGPRWTKIDPSWITVSLVPAPYVDHVADWPRGLPFQDNSVSIIYASHVLEHIWWYDTVTALKEAFRILRPGGVLEIHVPDFRKILFSYICRECGDEWRKFNKGNDYLEWLNGRIFSYEAPGNCHRAVFDRERLRNCIIESGFDFADGAPFRGSSKHLEIDLAATAVKK